MNRLIKLTLATGSLMLLILFWTCTFVEDESNEIQPMTQQAVIPGQTGPLMVLRGNQSGVPVKSGSNHKMQLGAKKTNPYAVTNMTNAWNNLYAAHYEKLPVTDLYVRFLPENLQEYAVLDSLGLELLDFPMDYEVTQTGDYYQDPAIPEDRITWLYTVVKPDFAFPGITYEILDELHLVPYDSYLAAEAFRLAGQPYDQTALKQDGSGQSGLELLYPEPVCDPDCPSYPCCLTGLVDCGDDVVPQWCKGLNPDCLPGQSGYPDCLSTGGDGPGGGTLNDCGCVVPGNARTPAGCVQVVDTELPDNSLINGKSVHADGVRDVRIVWWNGWFDIRKTFTDENGCWAINHRESGRAYMWVKFKSDQKTIRGLRGARIWEYAAAIQDQAYFSGPPYNNIRIVYFPDNDNGSRDKAYWFAATANNAIYEYNEYAAADGIPGVPMELDVLLTNFGGSAAAPMFDDMSNNPLISMAAYEIGMVAAGVLSVGFLPATVTLAAFWAYIVAYSPDVIFNYGELTDFPSDRLKRTMYHEYGHAAHFHAIGDDIYWLNNAIYLVGNQISGTNPPYGDGTKPGAGPTAVIEMWGNHIGFMYADRTYGMHHSLVTNSDPVIINRHRHLNALERFDPKAALGSPNANDPEDAWIPAGLLLDCMDDNALNPTAVADPVVDMVKDFSMATCFQAVVAGRACIPCVKTFMLQHLPPGQSAADLELLFSEYGF